MRRISHATTNLCPHETRPVLAALAGLLIVEETSAHGHAPLPLPGISRAIAGYLATYAPPGA